MPMFSTPLSGLNASSNALSVISNNLANLNTVGFKEQTASFQDLFYQNIGATGGGNPIQVGAGSAVGAVTSDFTNGNFDTSGVPTDVAITGEGFFVTQKDGGLGFTRNGHFTLQSDGELDTQDGRAVMGYPAINGAIDTSQNLAPIILGQGLISPPLATSNLQMTSNLDASAAIGATFSTPMSVFDTLGVSHILTFQFTKTGANNWSYNTTIAAPEVGLTGTPVSVATGNVTFDGNGVLTSPAGNVTGIAVTGLADGATDMNFNWNLYDKNNNPLLTQVASASTTSTTFQDGYASGTLLNFNVGSDGVIAGTFTNGKTSPIAQITLARFPNQQGLLRQGSNNYISSLASGDPVIGTPGDGGRGTVTGGALEQSNVDIATEFSKMIVAQRGFQANAKVVTTFDEITQDTINLRR